MKKFFLVAGALAALAVPSAAMAGSPTADGFTLKDNRTYDQSNLVGRYTAQITHNGWSIGGNKHMTADTVETGADETTAPGTRADLVHAALGH